MNDALRANANAKFAFTIVVLLSGELSKLGELTSVGVCRSVSDSNHSSPDYHFPPFISRASSPGRRSSAHSVLLYSRDEQQQFDKHINV